MSGAVLLLFSLGLRVCMCVDACRLAVSLSTALTKYLWPFWRIPVRHCFRTHPRPPDSRVHPPLLCISTNPDLSPSSAKLDSSLPRAAPFARRRLIPTARPNWIRGCGEPRCALDVASFPQHRDESGGHSGQCQEVELGPGV
jgi:hypothetical protein